MKTKLIIVAFAVLLTLTLVAQQQPKVSEPDAGIIAKLTEIVQIRKQLVEYYQAEYDAGHALSATVDGMQWAAVELAEARVNLARERGQREPLIAALQELVAAHEQRAEMTKRRSSESGSNAAKVEVERTQVALLEAQVRLLRAQK